MILLEITITMVGLPGLWYYVIRLIYHYTFSETKLLPRPFQRNSLVHNTMYRKFRACTENSLAKKSLAIALYYYCNKQIANIAIAIPTLMAKGVSELILAEPSMLGVLITAALGFPTSSITVFHGTNAG